jgi:hypothetical protein
MQIVHCPMTSAGGPLPVQQDLAEPLPRHDTEYGGVPTVQNDELAPVRAGHRDPVVPPVDAEQHRDPLPQAPLELTSALLRVSPSH